MKNVRYGNRTYEQLSESATHPMATHSLPFTQLAPGIGVGAPMPQDWRSLLDCPLLIMVGVTGVGKSTTLEKLAETRWHHTLLPDRRVLTDSLIIAYMQALDGQPIQPIADRKLRFEYTRRYRERFAGGMSHALTQLCVDPAQLGGNLIFDGLRGADEVTHAIQALPQARFVVLNAPDVVRVQRLLGRNDAFDQVGGSSTTLPSQMKVANFAMLGLPEASALFNPTEEQHLLALVQQGAVSAHDLRAKLQIVMEERRNYDPTEAIAVLQSDVPARSLILDTTRYTPDEVATHMRDFVENL